MCIWSLTQCLRILEFVRVLGFSMMMLDMGFQMIFDVPFFSFYDLKVEEQVDLPLGFFSFYIAVSDFLSCFFILKCICATITYPYVVPTPTYPLPILLLSY